VPSDLHPPSVRRGAKVIPRGMRRLAGLATQSAHAPLELISQSRLEGPGLSRSRRSLSALKRRISSSSALFFSSRMVMRDLGSSLPRNFSSAVPTSSFLRRARFLSSERTERGRPPAPRRGHSAGLHEFTDFLLSAARSRMRKPRQGSRLSFPIRSIARPGEETRKAAPVAQR
jgi:hypothetical protein